MKLAAAVKRYLLYTVQTGSFVGLVKYSTTPTTLTPSLVEIRTNVHRNQLANLIVPEQGGKTAIGQGLLAAQKVELMVRLAHFPLSNIFQSLVMT